MTFQYIKNLSKDLIAKQREWYQFNEENTYGFIPVKNNNNEDYNYGVDLVSRNKERGYDLFFVRILFNDVNTIIISIDSNQKWINDSKIIIDTNTDLNNFEWIYHVENYYEIISQIFEKFIIID